MKLGAAKAELDRHPTYEMAVVVQLAKRDLGVAVAINRRIMRSVT